MWEHTDTASSGVDTLTNMFKHCEWFHSVGHDQYNRLVVYTNFMCNETLHDIPDRINGNQVLVHLAASQTSMASQASNVVPLFIQAAQQAQSNAVDVGVGQMMDLEFPFVENSLKNLGNELDRLEKICGSNILQDIFYEIHDQKNAITNLSSKYPEVRLAMEKIYDEYGFDIVYDNLDG